MKKRLWGVLLAGVMSLLLVACGGGAAKTETSTETETKTETTQVAEKPAETKTIKIFQFKVEIAEQLERMIREYEELHPGIKIELETAGGGADYGAILKSKFASGDEPDIFNNGGFSEKDMWIEKLEDLSNEPWVQYASDVAKEPMTKDGKLYGMPMNVEGYGFLYNKDLFKKAGITAIPKTINELEEACKKLEAIGIQPFSTGYQETWVLGIHNFNVLLANQDDPDAFIEGLKNGTVSVKDNPITDEWLNLLELTAKYGGKNPITVDYNTQVTDFASGKTAMMQQGNWTQVQISQINPDIKVGLMPMAYSSKPQEKIFLGVPNNWCVYNQSPVKDEAKAFLDWMVSSEVGQRYMIKEFKFIPAFTNISFDVADLGDIAAEIQQYSAKDALLGWHWPKLPDGTFQEIGSGMQQYIATYQKDGKGDREFMYQLIENTVKDLATK